jgi:hypothetical protein
MNADAVLIIVDCVTVAQELETLNSAAPTRA